MQDNPISGTRPIYKIDSAKLKNAYYEMGPIRPPSEGQDRSLLIRVTRNCPWNKCLFCNAYREQKFEYRGAEEVKGDIDIAKALADEIKTASWKLGYGGNVSNEVLNIMVSSNPEIYNRDYVAPGILMMRYHSLTNVANWLNSGARTVFLQDANSIIMRTPDLVEVLNHLKQTFPGRQQKPA